MSPAVGQQNIPMPPRPSSSQSEGGGSNSSNSNSGGGGGARSGAPGLPPGVPPGAPGPYPPPHHQPYKMPPHQPYPPPQHQYPPQGNYSPRPPYPNAGYGGMPAGAGQYGAPGRPPPPGPVGGPPGGPPPQGYPGWGGARGPPPPPPHYLKQHLQHKMGPPAPHIMGPPGDPSQQDNGPPATALVTTGPDGTPLDDGSQQSTLSNASAASGEENMNRRGIGGASSPGAASHASGHDDYDASPSSWPRTQPSSPVFNSHVPQENYRTKQKSDSLCKLFEMDNCPERRSWVERLLAFMEERRTPISSCPTISKQPLDLYRLYLYVRERGGFLEVCKVTKNKTWKDIAGLLGIGASSSAAYTLRKHYTKNLLPFECHFDRGGIDPQPIINQVEATTKKKSNKNNSVPSPGSSNSQDSFPGPGGPPPEGYGPPYSPYPPPTQGQPGGPGGDNMAASNPFEDPQPRRNHQPGYPGAGQGYGYDQYGGAYPPNRPVYPPYAPEGDNRGYPGPGGDPYTRYGPGYGGSPGGPPRGYAPPPPSGPPAPPESPTPPPSGAPPPPQQPGGPPPPQDYYRSPQPQQHEGYGASKPPQMPGSTVGPVQSPGPGQPPPVVQGQPRRHPDFAKEPPPGSQPPYPPPGTPPRGAAPPHHQYAWNNNNSGQYRGQFPPGVPNSVNSSSVNSSLPQQQPPPGPINTISNNNSTSGGQWSTGTPARPAPVPSSPQQQPQTWGPQPYPQQQPPQPPQQWGPAGARPNQAPTRPTTPYRPDIKPYPMPGPGQTPNKGGVGVAPKREITFPSDSVEGVTPVTYKRRRVTKMDVVPVEAWRIMMALKSGLLAETCWALDLLNILLFDDSSVVYFGLHHLPGLLDLLLEHFQKSLADIFDPPSLDSAPWYLPKLEEENVSPNSLATRISDQTQKGVQLLTIEENYTTESRKGRAVIHKTKEEDLFAPEEVKEWELSEEHLNNEVGIDPWQFASDTAYVSHVLPCFQGEFINIPFARVLEGRKRLLKEEKPHSERCASGDRNTSEATNTSGSADNTSSSVSGINSDSGISREEECQGVVTSDSISENSGESGRKGRTKVASSPGTLSRVTYSSNNSNSEGSQAHHSDSDVSNKLDNGEPQPSNDCSKPLKPQAGQEDTPPVDVARQNGPTEDAGGSESCDKESMDLEDNLTSEPMEIEKDEKPVVEKTIEKKHDLKIKDPAGTLKRRPLSEYEDECYTRDEASLYLVSESQDSLARRCMCLSNILRNLTFVPGNEAEFSKSGTFLALMGKLLLLHHEHPVRAPRTRNYDREEDAEWKGSCSSLGGGSEWWWDVLQQLREDALVCCANIGGQVDLIKHPEQVSRPVLDGLLHWAVCPSAQALDPLPALAPHRALSPRRLALEALCKICVTPSNVDLVVATPPFPRLQQLCSVLSKHLCRSEDQVLREFSVNLLHYLASADSAMARVIAANNPTVSLLVAFIEQAEQSALGVANQLGIGALRDNPDSMGTSLDMLRRAAATLLQLSRHPENKPLFVQQEQRLLSLVMSQILDQKVAAELSKVLFQCSRSPRSRYDF